MGGQQQRRGARGQNLTVRIIPGQLHLISLQALEAVRCGAGVAEVV